LLSWQDWAGQVKVNEQGGGRTRELVTSSDEVTLGQE
jgi:hypothetical protein